MALRRTMLNGGGGFGDRYAYPYRPIYRAPIVTNKITPEKIPIAINFKSEPLYLGWDDPTPIYCMKPNPNVQTVRALMCKPNKAAIAEMADRLKPSFAPNGDVVIKAENGNGETVEIVVNGNGEIVAEKKAPNIMPLVLAAGAALFFLM